MIPVMIHYLRTFWIHQWRKWFCCIKVSKITQCQLIHLVTPKDSKEKAANSIKEPCSFLRFVTSAAVCFPVAPRFLPNLPLAHGAATLFPADWSKGPRSQRVHLELGWFEWTFLVGMHNESNQFNLSIQSRTNPCLSTNIYESTCWLSTNHSFVCSLLQAEKASGVFGKAQCLSKHELTGGTLLGFVEMKCQYIIYHYPDKTILYVYIYIACMISTAQRPINRIIPTYIRLLCKWFMYIKIIKHVLYIGMCIHHDYPSFWIRACMLMNCNAWGLQSCERSIWPIRIVWVTACKLLAASSWAEPFLGFQISSQVYFEYSLNWFLCTAQHDCGPGRVYVSRPCLSVRQVTSTKSRGSHTCAGKISRTQN